MMLKLPSAVLMSLLVAVASCAPGARPGGETASARAALTSEPGETVTAAPTANDYELQVQWDDFPDETSYTLLQNTNLGAGFPVITSGSSPEGATFAPGWTVVTELPADTTSFTHPTSFATTYAVCAFDANAGGGLAVECHVSNRAQPRVPDIASIDSLQVSLRTTTSLRVQWTQSPNTVASTASISPRDAAASPVVNDADQSVTFTGLTPNADHTITVCVQSADDVASGEQTCQSVTARTLVLAPLAVSSISVNQGDPSPTSRTITFGYDNTEAAAVIAFSVRLIRNDAIEQQVYVYPSGFGPATYPVTFNNLLPFTAYEVWVAPYNSSGVGPAAGVGFTTPTDVNVSPPLPLSGNSAMISFDANAVGAWIVERLDGTTYTELGRVQVNTPGPRRVVVQGVTAPETVRVSWHLAYLRSHSGDFTVSPGPAGAPELSSLTSRPVFINPPPSRVTAVLLPTVTNHTEYVLQARLFGSSAWTTIASTGRPLLLPLFTAGQPVTLSAQVNALVQSYRVCQRTLVSRSLTEVLSCSAESANQSAGLPRF